MSVTIPYTFKARMEKKSPFYMDLYLKRGGEV